MPRGKRKTNVEPKLSDPPQDKRLRTSQDYTELQPFLKSTLKMNHKMLNSNRAREKKTKNVMKTKSKELKAQGKRMRPSSKQSFKNQNK